MNDDYSADNKLQINGKLKSKTSTLKLNHVAQTKYTDQNNFTVTDDAQVDFKYRGLPVQFKLKPKNMTTTLDLGHYSRTMYNQECWFNPYVQLNNSRDLKNPVFNFGHLFTSGNYKENARLNISRRENVNVELEANCTYKRGDVSMNLYLKQNLSSSIWTSLSRKFNFAYDKNDVHLSLEGVQKNKSWKNWNMDNVQVGLAYSGVNKVTFGFAADVDMNKDNEVTKTVFVSGKLDDNFNYKMKLNNRLDANLFSNMKLCSSFNLQCSVGANLSNCENRNGFLGNPFNLGMKLKFNE